MKLAGTVVRKAGFDLALTAQLYDLYERYYAPTSMDVFARDLAAKTYCILIHEPQGRICGFSTVARHKLQTGAGEIEMLFSGDTVVDQFYWGEQTLPFTWIEEAGRIKAERPDVPLYWLLITKGHRTFRYLPGFAYAYHPQPGSDPALTTLATEVARQIFNARFDVGTGILRPEASCPTALRPEFGGFDSARIGNPHVQDFLSRNPNHARGEELVCFCELSIENLKPRARSQFLLGMT